MPVDALELKPRSAVAIFDAALRVCATSTGVWAFTLPAGAALVAALLNLAETVRFHRPLALPVALWTLAWLVRGWSQGAACHFLEQQLLGPEEPSLRRSCLAAIKRAPSLVIATAYLAALNGALWLLTGGLGLLFVGAPLVGYAAIMRGQGHPLQLHGTCSRLLGSARHSAGWVRLCGATQPLVAINLHLAVAGFIWAGNSLLGLDLTFLARFASLDNGVWVATLAVLTFSLFEPLRAATATLLLIDGRVRQEGLDLVALVRELQPRRKARATLPSAMTALCLALLVPAAAPAQQHAELRHRMERVIEACELEESIPEEALDAVGRLDAKDQAALDRFTTRLERLAFNDEACEAADVALRMGLEQVGASLSADTDANAGHAREAAKAILARPEFQPVPKSGDPTEAEPAAGPEEESWFQKLLRRFLEWLRESPPRDPELAPPPVSGWNGPMAGANLVMGLAIAGVLGIIGYLLWKGRLKKTSLELAGESSGLAVSPLAGIDQGALARSPETWAGLADEFAARGEFREAIRHVYLALLSRLHHDGVIDYEPTQSNWDYLAGFRGGSPLRGAFRELTLRFDFAWYGRLDVSDGAYRAFRGLAEPWLAPLQGEVPAHA
jgi:hypothetical protein